MKSDNMKQAQSFLGILSNAVNEKKIKIEEPVDWEEMLQIASQQNVFALIYEMACKDQSFKSSSDHLFFSKIAIQQVFSQTMQTRAFEKLYKAFDAADLHPIVMKGIICRQLYGKYCNHRPSGDEDILIRPEEFDAVRKVMTDNGFAVERENITDWDLKEMQEITFESDTLKVEVHLNPIGHDGSFRRKMNDYFNREVFDRAQDIEIDHISYHIMSHTDHYLFLVIHAFKHFIGSGVGVRQLLDILLYRSRYAQAIDWNYIETSLNDIDAFSFYVDLMTIGERYMNFPSIASCEGFDEKENCPDALLKDMMEGGTFGNSDMAHSMSSRLLAAAFIEKDKNTGKEQKPGKIRMLFDVAFPGIEQLRYWYPEIDIKPWHVPFLWIRRYYRFIRRSIQNGKGLASESTNIGMQRLELLRKYGILD